MQRRTLVKRKIDNGVAAPDHLNGADSDSNDSSQGDHVQGESGNVFGNAISLAASRITEMAPLQGLLPDGEDDAFISFGRAASSSSSGESDRDEGEGYESDRSDIPDKDDLSTSTAQSPTTRENFSGAIFEQRVAADVREAHLTLLTLPSPLTLQGPCGVYGLGGETSINGYLIGQKRMLLPTRHDRATAAPVKRLGTRTSEATSPPHDDADPESVFGIVNWGWVQERLESWSRRNSVQMSVLLVIQHRETSKRQWFEKSSPDSKEIPSFIANYRYLSTPPPVLDVISTVAKQTKAVVGVLGERDVGKSTMCRMVSNALLSQHGKCYWVDLDLGQPEFTVPGCLSITLLKKPLTTDVIPSEARSLEKSIFIGTTSISCPVSYATAVKTLCDYVQTNNCFPCVINTHGWVQSAGRRGSLECLRRLRATHIFHLGRSGGADMEWSTGRIIGDPTQGFNNTISTGRFWNGTDVKGSLPAVEAARPYHCRIHHVDTSIKSGPVSIKAGKRDREEVDSTARKDDAPADAQVYRILADYVVRPKGDNVKRRRAKWFNYFNPLWSGDVAAHTVVSFELTKLPFVAIAGADETNAACSGVPSVVSEILKDTIVALCVLGSDVVPTPRIGLLGTYSVSPSVLCFGVVQSQEKGVVTVALPHPQSFLSEVLGVHTGRIGIVASPDRGDYGGVLQKAAAGL